MNKRFYFLLAVFLIQISLFAINGYPGHTINLDGGECVEVPYSADLNPSQFTVSFWAKVEDGVGTYRSPITSRSATTGFMFYASDDDHWEFWTRSGSTTSMKIEGPLVTLNKWTHIAGTYDGTKMTFYVDGTFAGEFWGSSFVPNTQYPLRIGAGNSESTPDYFFYGNIDEVSLWNYAKTVDEVREGMHNTFSDSETGLVSYWQFNDDLIDSVGDNNGTSYQLEFPDDMIVSDVLVGSGESDHYIFDQVASYDFVDTDIAIHITEETGIDSILVSRIERTPNVIPDGYDATYSHWVFREFGSGTYTADVMFYTDYDIPDSYSGKNSYFRLYSRDIDSTGTWTFVSEPTILSTQDDYMIFSDLDLNSQYMISYNKLPQISTSQLPYSYTNTGTLLSVSSRAVPTAADIDNDGHLDLIVGKSDGTLSHYEADMFDPENFSLVTDNFCGIDVGTYAAPTFVDLDSNGRLDLVIGNSDGNLLKYSQNIVAPEVFTYSTMLDDNIFNPIDIGSSSAPVFCDLNDDGLLDLYVGCSSNDVIYVSEQITGNVFSDPFPITKGNGSYQKPTIGDIDNDGLLDMLIGNNAGTISHYEQTTPTSGFSLLLSDNFNNIDVGTYSAPFIQDIDGDGSTNLLIGDTNGNITYFNQSSCDSLDFDNQLANTVSEPLNYVVSANGLSSNLSIDSPEGFTISLSEDSGYHPSFSIIPVNGSVSDTIYVRFEPLLQQGYTGNISHTSTDMIMKNIVLNGAGPIPDTIPGTALEFDGVDDYVQIQNSTTFNMTSNYTLEAWIKPEGFSSSAGIISKYHTVAANGYMLRLTNISPYTGLRFDEMYTSNNLLEAGKWYHVAAVNDNGVRHLYLNGQEQTLTGTPLNVQSNSDDLTIGVDYLESGRYFDGKIDEVRIWNTARTEEEIRESINLPLDGNESGLVSYWQFNEGSGSTTSTIGSTGTLTNMDDTDWVGSTIPFGGGFVNTQIVSTTGILNFTDTDLSMNFTAKTSTDTIVVTNIEYNPNIDPADVETVFNSQYWVVNKYGSGTFTTDITLTIAEDLTIQDETSPSLITLYSRSSNSDTEWTSCVSAVSVNAASNTATFSDITDFSQLIISRDNLSIPQNLVTTITGADLELSWDAVTGASSYKIYSSNDPYGIFVEDTGGNFTGESWTIAYSESKKFYYVVAVDGTKLPVTKKINVNKVREIR